LALGKQKAATTIDNVLHMGLPAQLGNLAIGFKSYIIMSSYHTYVEPWYNVFEGSLVLKSFGKESKIPTNLL
jgi:hypothetical protein